MWREEGESKAETDSAEKEGERWGQRQAAGGQESRAESREGAGKRVNSFSRIQECLM